MASYSGIFLDDNSKKLLFKKFKLPIGWKPYADHLTIKLGNLPEELKQHLGKTFKIKIDKIGISGTNMAFGVDTKLSKNKIPHITFAVDTNKGGRPKDSNEISKWKSISPVYVTGKLLEI